MQTRETAPAASVCFVLIRWMERRITSCLLCGIVLAACAGCQTFSLSEEDLQKQQRGEMADRQTGEVVGLVGSIGYLGAIVGAAVAEAAKR
jgi:nitrate/nitrite transporter NarK